MQYDFRKVQKAIDLSGKTMLDVERMTGINNGTLSRILRTGRAHQSSALKLVKAFRLTMADVLPAERKFA